MGLSRIDFGKVPKMKTYNKVVHSIYPERLINVSLHFKKGYLYLPGFLFIQEDNLKMCLIWLETISNAKIWSKNSL